MEQGYIDELVNGILGVMRNQVFSIILFGSMARGDFDAESDDNEGKEDGHKEMLLDKISKKLSKGKSVSQIADELEESEDTISGLIKEIKNTRVY